MWNGSDLRLRLLCYSGLAVVFAENVPGQLAGSDSEIVTEAWKELCPTWNSLTVGKQFAVNDTS